MPQWRQFFHIMKTPLVLTNFKNYESAVGESALELAKIHEAAAQKTGVSFAVAVSVLDLSNIAKSVCVPVFAQHADNADFGSTTGSIVPKLLKKLGATGVILNHSEKRFSDFVSLQKAAEKCREAGLVVVICAETAEEGAKIAKEINPDFVAVEPPELIGGDISVSTAQPELISDSVAAIGAGKVLVGAGVKNGEDVRIAVELGAVGVLLASGVTKARNPAEVLEDLASKI